MGRRQAAAAAAAAISEAATAAKSTQAELKQLELDYQPRKVGRRHLCRDAGLLSVARRLLYLCMQCQHGSLPTSPRHFRPAGRHSQVEEGQQGASAAHRPILRTLMASQWCHVRLLVSALSWGRLAGQAD